MRIALECGTHSPWMSRLLKQLGHQVIVANARKIPAITASESKNDRNDAEQLARFAAYDPRLLSPLQHRSLAAPAGPEPDPGALHLVRARTMIVNALRGLVKSAGGRLPACSTESLASPRASRDSARSGRGGRPAARADRLLNAADRRHGPADRKAGHQISGDRHSAHRTGRRPAGGRGLRAHPRPARCGSAAAARREPSSACVPAKASRATRIRNGASPRPATAICAACWCSRRNTSWAASVPIRHLRRWGLKLAASGGKRGKKRAIVAVARKLAVILHSMWRSGQRFQPFPQPATEWPDRNPPQPRHQSDKTRTKDGSKQQ